MIYTVCARIRGYIHNEGEIADEFKEFSEGESFAEYTAQNADCGGLCNLEMYEKKCSKNCCAMTGTYKFAVEAQNEKQALKLAPKVFADIWAEGIDVGIMQDSEQVRYDDGKKEMFRINAVVRDREDIEL